MCDSRPLLKLAWTASCGLRPPRGSMYPSMTEATPTIGAAGRLSDEQQEKQERVHANGSAPKSVEASNLSPGCLLRVLFNISLWHADADGGVHPIILR